MRISIRTKLFFLVTVLLLGTISAVLWKTRDIFFEDKTDFIRQLSSKLSSSSGRLAQERVTELQNKLALFVSTRESLQKIKTSQDTNQVLFERYQDFIGVSVQKSLGTEKTGGDKGSKTKFDTAWIQVNKSSQMPIDESYLETVLRSIPYSNISANSVYLARFEDKAKKPFFGIVFTADLKEQGATQEQVSAVVGFIKPDFFKDIVLEYKGDLNTVFLVDDKGYIFAHPQDELIGSSFTDHAVVKEIISGRSNVSGRFEMADGQKIFSGSNNISGTNLFAVITTPESEAFKSARDLLIAVLAFGLGFIIIGSVLSFIFSSRIIKPLIELREVAKEIGAGDFKVQINVKTNDEIGELAESIEKMKSSLLERDEQIENSKMALVQSEKMSAFGQLSAGIAHEVKNPLAGILGHAQLAKGKSKDPDVTKHLDMIERETRRTKEIIENLMRFARAEKPELSPTDLHETVSRAVDLVDHQISLMGIKIIRDFHPVNQANANSNQVQQVLLNIMMNAGHAMETAKTKELTVSVENKGDWVQIRIKDSGSGMTPEVQKKIFEPFFTTKPAGKGTGLGLSVSIGIVQDHKGKIYVESQVGKGTTFFIDIPKVGSVASQAEAAPVPRPITSSTAVAGVTLPAEKMEVREATLSSIITAQHKVSETKSSIRLPEFGAAKNETSLDKEVQRDYLKSHNQKAESESPKSLHEIKREAQAILKKEQAANDGAKQVDAKSDDLKLDMDMSAMNSEKSKFNDKSKDDNGFKVEIRKAKIKIQ